MFLSVGLPLACIAAYVFMSLRERGSEELVRDVEFWIPIGIMVTLMAVSIIFGVIGIVLMVAALVILARRLEA